MKTLALTRTVLFGEPPLKYAVTFHVGDHERHVKIVGPGAGGQPVTRWLQWSGKQFRPGCLAMTEQAVCFFREREAADLPDDRADVANEELIIAGRLPAGSRRRFDSHERQLPRSDRTEVG